MTAAERDAAEANLARVEEAARRAFSFELVAPPDLAAPLAEPNAQAIEDSINRAIGDFPNRERVKVIEARISGDKLSVVLSVPPDLAHLFTSAPPREGGDP